MASCVKIQDYGKLTLKELKDELRKRGARLSGRKKELVERLEAYERNLNFTNPDETLAGQSAEFTMELPDVANYKDMNSETSFVNFTETELKQYLSQFQKELTKDATDLYDERFIRYARMAAKDNKIYIQSECRAQMKKSVTYKLDISFNKEGHILEAQCECGAGMGPEAHCKHVCALVFGLSKFTRNGELRTELTCTERLQTFHHCKRFKGSPKKCQDLQLSVSDNQPKNPVFDPTEDLEDDTSTYVTHFTNICKGSKFSNIPVMQLFNPGNIHATALDHHYFSGTPEEKFLNDEKIEKITEPERNDFERKTVGQNASKLWMMERTKRLHSSNFGRICKATELTDKQKLAKSYTTTKEINTPAIKHGRKYEKSAIKKLETEKAVEVNKCGTFISLSHPYLASAPDGTVSESSVVEVKCPYVAKDRDINPATVPYLKEEDGKLILDKNHDYYYQIQGQLFCCGKDECYFCVYTFKDFVVIKVSKDDEFIQAMVQKLERFNQEYFKQAVLETHLYRNYYNYGFQTRSSNH